MNAETQPVIDQSVTLQPLTPSELTNAAQQRSAWLWHGYLAPGKLTALISPPKTGKTTLMARLLTRLGQGGELAGRAVTPGRALVVSEESPADWDSRCRQLAIGSHVQFLCRPFRGARPTEAHWSELIAGMENLYLQQAMNLVVLDPLAALLPGYAETCAPKLLDCLLPLQALAALGPAVLLLHHPTKARRIDGQAARGSGALTGFADIVMEMSHFRRPRSRDRRRRLCAYSRYEETPRQLIVELTEDGSDYMVRGDGGPVQKPWPVLQDLLAKAHQKFSLKDLLEFWPSDEDRPDRTTLSRWLQRAVKSGQVCCAGTGLRGDPFVYWLAEREPLIFPGHDAGQEAIDAWKARCTAEVHRFFTGEGRSDGE